MNTTNSQKGLVRRVAGMFPPPPILKMAAPGIDINEHEVRFVDLVDTGRGKELRTYGMKYIPQGVIKRGNIQNKEALIDILGEIAEENRFNFVRSSLPDERAYLFQTNVGASMEPEEIRTMLEFKLEEYVPISSKEAIFDYTPIVLEGKEMRLSVSVFSKKLVERYAEIFEKAGMTPFSLEADTQAITRSVIPSEGAEENYMIVNFGQLRTNLAIVFNGVVSFTTTLEIGGNELERVIKENFSAAESRQDFRRIKREVGLIESKSKKDFFFSIMSTVSALKDEMNRHLSYWRSRMQESEGAEGISKIVLSGENAVLAGLAEYLQDSMSIPTERADIWKNAFSTEEIIPSLARENSYEYATAVGLALRREGKE